MTKKEINARTELTMLIRTLKKQKYTSMASQNSLGVPIGIIYKEELHKKLNFIFNEYLEININTKKLKEAIDLYADIKNINIRELLDYLIVIIEKLEAVRKKL